jgi:hypothetical protein
MKSKSQNVSAEDKRVAAINSLQYGGRAMSSELREIADMSVIDLLGAGLTLEQAETVIKMAAIEISRLAEESRMIPKVPGVEVKFDKRKK